MMHKPNHMLCIMKQNFEPPIACYSTNIGLEAHVSRPILGLMYPKILQIRVGMFHIVFSNFWSWYHSYTPSCHIMRSYWPFQLYLLALSKTQSFSSHIQLPCLDSISRSTFGHHQRCL